MFTYYRYGNKKGDISRNQDPEIVTLLPVTPGENGHRDDRNIITEIESPIDLDKIKLDKILARGRYGTVWRATIDNQDYAVKTFALSVRHFI